MHVGAKKMATAGLLVAVSVVFVWLSSIVESSSLFFIAGASFFVGVAIREWGLRFGFAFLAAGVVLNFLIAPNKLYCFTYVAMSVYLWVSELLFVKIADAKSLKHKTTALWLGKYICFNLIYIPVLVFFPSLLFSGKINGLFVVLMVLLGQVVLFVYDIAYQYFQSQVWGRIRARLLKRN